MKKIFFSILLFLCFQFSFSQNPLVKQWDYRYGGFGHDELTSLKQTSDGGFILGGFSLSGIGGNKTQPSWGGEDYWIVKTDAIGNYEWDRRFGGTAYADRLTSLEQTTDEGYILGGYSASGISGDKTQPCWGYYDYWIVKIGPLGYYQWDKRFGGTDYDALFSIKQTSDGGYILAGSSTSDIGGDKTEPSWGVDDYWIVKIDAFGNKQWDKRFGGMSDDVLTSLILTSDGGFLLGGYSGSDSTGDKTQNCRGSSDYWIVKTDALGNKQWDKRFGGSLFDHLCSVQQCDDKGYFLCGVSNSPIGGDKTVANHDSLVGTIYATFDFWVVKTDSLGNQLWDSAYGGITNEDEIGSLQKTADKGFLIGGTSYSNISGDKSEDNLGLEQTWVIKIDSSGNKQWDKTLHTQAPSHDEIGFAIQTTDGCYLMANFTDAGIGGDKTQPSWGTYLNSDYWVIKYCDTTLTGIISTSPDKTQFQISPNPFTQSATLSFNQAGAGKYDFLLFDVFGREVVSVMNLRRNTTITRGNLASGVYFYRVVSGGAVICSRKVVIE